MALVDLCHRSFNYKSTNCAGNQIENQIECAGRFSNEYFLMRANISHSPQSTHRLRRHAIEDESSLMQTFLSVLCRIVTFISLRISPLWLCGGRRMRNKFGIKDLLMEIVVDSDTECCANHRLPGDCDVIQLTSGGPVAHKGFKWTHTSLGSSLTDGPEVIVHDCHFTVKIVSENFSNEKFVINSN